MFYRQFYPHSSGTKKKKKSLLHYRDGFSKDSKTPHVVSVPWTRGEISVSNTFFKTPYQTPKAHTEMTDTAGSLP